MERFIDGRIDEYQEIRLRSEALVPFQDVVAVSSPRGPIPLSPMSSEALATLVGLRGPRVEEADAGHAAESGQGALAVVHLAV